MPKRPVVSVLASATTLILATFAASGPSARAADLRIDPASLPSVAKVDDRFQSYNVEMAEVIGAQFWAPYPKPGAPAAAGPAGMFRKRDPINLADVRLRTLARALGPAYVRVSGSWANTVYFQDDDAPQAATPPPGYKGVLTRAQWAGVLSFAKAVDAKVVTSFAVGTGSRGANGVWDPAQARQLVDFTHRVGGSIYAAELINEPNVGPLVGLPKTYTAKSFALDEAAFRGFRKADAPEMKTVGPGSTGEAGFQLFPPVPGSISTEALMSAQPRPVFDVFSYHGYGTVSQRCAGMGPGLGTSPDQALSEAWLARDEEIYTYYKGMHDQFAPGTPIWVTETAQAACGGDRWAASFLDTFRYVDQMGRLAKHGVAALFHNTLTASDYALIDEATGLPRPNYWAAVLWRRLMGRTVLDAGPLTPGLHAYAQCLRGRPGGVAVVVLNLDRGKTAELTLSGPARRYTLSAKELTGGDVDLNGQPLALIDDRLPAMTPIEITGRDVKLAPASITFLAMPTANNRACR